jgi:hypothetical protein
MDLAPSGAGGAYPPTRCTLAATWCERVGQSRPTDAIASDERSGDVGRFFEDSSIDASIRPVRNARAARATARDDITLLSLR